MSTLAPAGISVLALAGALLAIPAGPTTSTAQALVTECGTLHATVNGVHMHAQFSNPVDPCTPGGVINADKTHDTVIIDELIRLINKVPSGGTIRGAIADIENIDVAKALHNAKSRGVTVRLAINGNQKNMNNVEAIVNPNYGLKNAFTDTQRTFCESGVNYACNSSVHGGPEKVNAFAHTKLFTFSQTTSPESPNGALVSNVIWVSSANLAPSSSTATSNNAIQYFGASTAYNQMTDHLKKMFNEDPRTINYDSGYYTGSSVFSAWASPRTEDFVEKQIRTLAPGNGCTVRVLQNTFIGRPNLAVALADKKDPDRGGCDIKVIVSKEYGQPNSAARIGGGALDTLRTAGIPVYTHFGIHDKVLLLRGTLDGTPNRSAVFTGSHNWTDDALGDNDEIFVKVPDVADGQMYRLFNRHFETVLNDGHSHRLYEVSN